MSVNIVSPVSLVKKARRAFTLIEIMIVVLIIGILLAIAVPNFVRARESSRAKACVANLKQIDSAKEQFAMDTKAVAGAAVTMLNVADGTAASYIKTTPTCPANGAYTVGAVGTNPICGYNATAPAYAPHLLP